jgi:hypothetical protein
LFHCLTDAKPVVTQCNHLMGRHEMPIAFYYPEHWNAIFATAELRCSWLESLTSLLKRR